MEANLQKIPIWSSRTPAHRRIGKWSAIVIVVLSAAYITTGVIWMWSSARSVRIQGLEPSEPFLTILETLILLLTPALVALFAAIHSYAPPEKKTFSLASFGFAVILAGLTGMIHFVQLTALRRTASKTIAEVFALYNPNSLTPTLATDLVAWDFFLGFGLLFAAPIFKGDKLQLAIRVSMILAGLLCLFGVAGPASGDLRFQYPAIIGYAFVFPFTCLLLAIQFARDA